MWAGCLAGLAETFFILWIWKKYGIWNFKPIKEKKKTLVLLMLTGLSVILCSLLFSYVRDLLTQLNQLAAYLILTAAAGVDWKKQVIPNGLIAGGLAFRTILLIGVFLVDPQDAPGVLLQSGLGFLISLLFMLLLSFLSRNGIGYGDVKLFSWIGYCFGISMTYNILFYSALFAAMAGIWLMFVKKANKKTKVPFGPFIWCGSYLVFCMTIFSQ